MPMFEFIGAVIKSCRYACEGIVFVARSQRNFRIHLIAAVVVLGCGFFLRFTRLEMGLLLLTVLGVVCGELFNSALECTLNLLEARQHPVAKAAKDIAAGAVFLAVLGSIVIGIFLFGPRLWGFLVWLRSR